VIDIRYVRRTAKQNKGPFFQHSIFFGTWFFFSKVFFSNHHSSTTIKPHHIFSIIILQTHIFKVSTARLFRLGSVNARVGLIFFSDKCYFFVFAVEVACWFKKNHKRTHLYLFFFFRFFEIGKIWTVNREYLGLIKGKKIIRQKKKDFKFFLCLATESKL